MKLIKCTNLLVLTLALTCIFTGCRKGPAKVTNIPGYGREKGIGDPGPGIDRGPIVDPGATGIPLSGAGHVGWPEDRLVLQSETVHFAFDSSEIRSSEKSKIQAVADHLKKEADKALKVEGHCDERGTEGYNDALGSKRALAVREALVALGIAPDRVDIISFGESKPTVDGHDEAAWSKNRRAEFVVLSPPK